VRVIAMSRFGYLPTPRPADASPEAQADAHICLLDALGIGKAAVRGVSAGGPSAMQTAIRDPGRVSALVLVVPIAYKPGTVADSAPPVSDDKDALLMRLLGSDFLFWAALQVPRDPLIRHVLRCRAARRYGAGQTARPLRAGIHPHADARGERARRRRSGACRNRRVAHRVGQAMNSARKDTGA